ncbi:MAG: 1-acyl-sn-glycerol-3-phosphate acyltransferase [Saprospiraceae bacterium]|nr:1-acyl-sn-glycerol-3-phosphate acyltransferase [Saprospiraceae bacterium]
MIYRLLFYFANLIIRIYYRKIHTFGLEDIPRDKPLLIVSNHPSGFIEPILMACLFPIDLHFLVRGDLFEKKILRFLLVSTNQVPIYRFRDGFAGLRNNQKTIAKTIEVLKQNKAIIIFAEGSTNADIFLRPFQKGMARMAFQSMDGSPDLDLHILPVGVTFSASTRPGTEVILRAGKAFPVREFYTADPRMSKDKMEELNLYTRDRVLEQMIHLPDRAQEASFRQAWLMYNKPSHTGFLPRIVKDGALFSYLKEVEARINNTTTASLSTPDPMRVSPALGFRQTNWHWLMLPFAILGFVLWFIPVFAGFYLANAKVKQREFKASVQASASGGFTAIYIAVCLLTSLFIWPVGKVLPGFVVAVFMGISTLYFWEKQQLAKAA